MPHLIRDVCLLFAGLGGASIVAQPAAQPAAATSAPAVQAAARAIGATEADLTVTVTPPAPSTISVVFMYGLNPDGSGGEQTPPRTFIGSSATVHVKQLRPQTRYFLSALITPSYRKSAITSFVTAPAPNVAYQINKIGVQRVSAVAATVVAGITPPLPFPARGYFMFGPDQDVARTGQRTLANEYRGADMSAAANPLKPGTKYFFQAVLDLPSLGGAPPAQIKSAVGSFTTPAR
jgi:hypothetical protein